MAGANENPADDGVEITGGGGTATPAKGVEGAGTMGTSSISSNGKSGSDSWNGFAAGDGMLAATGVEGSTAGALAGDLSTGCVAAGGGVRGSIGGSTRGARPIPVAPAFGAGAGIVVVELLTPAGLTDFLIATPAP